MDSTGAPFYIPFADGATPANLIVITQAMAEGIRDALNKSASGQVADLAELATTSGSLGWQRVVLEGGATFRHNGTKYVQTTHAVFASDTARDTAYAKASGAFRVAGATAQGSGSYIARYTGAAWQPSAGLMPFGIGSTAAFTTGASAWAAMPLTNGTPTTSDITWASGAPSRFVLPMKARWRLTGEAVVGATTEGGLRFMVNGSMFYAETRGALVGGVARMVTTCEVSLNAGDYVELQYLSNLASAQFYTGRFTVTAIGPMP